DVSPEIALAKMEHLIWNPLVLFLQFTAWLQAVLLEIGQHPGIFWVRALLIKIQLITNHHQTVGFSVNNHVTSPCALILKNAHDGGDIPQILETMLRLMPTQVVDGIIARGHRHGAGAMDVRTGDITRGIADDKRLLRRNGMP